MRCFMLDTVVLATAVAGFVSSSAPATAFDSNGPMHQGNKCFHRPQAGAPDSLGYGGPCEPSQQSSSGRNAHASGNGGSDFHFASFDANGPMQQGTVCKQRVQTGQPDYFTYPGACAPSGRR